MLGYTLPAGTTDIDRKDVENILCSSFDHFSEGLKGSIVITIGTNNI